MSDIPTEPVEETIADRACRTLREAADALDAVPSALRYATIFGYRVQSDWLRTEAETIEGRINAYKEATGR